MIAAIADDLLGWDAFSLLLYDPRSDTLHAVLNMDVVNGQRAEVPPAAAVRPPSATARRTMAAGGNCSCETHPSSPTRTCGRLATRNNSPPP